MTKNLKYNFTIYGAPKAQSRPRFVVRSNKTVHCFDKLAHKKALDRTMVMSQLKENGVIQKLSEPISVELKFYMGIPKSLANIAKKRKEKLYGSPKPKTPDIDNLAKYYLDVMNDLIYTDDKLVTELICSKVYSEDKKTEICIRTLRDEEGDV